MTRNHIQTLVNMPKKGDKYKQTICYTENGKVCTKTITHYKKGSARMSNK